MIYLLLLIPVIAAIIESKFDAAKEGPIDHTASAVTRVIVAWIFSVIFLKYLVDWVVFTGILLQVFWIVFDPAYNLWKRRNPWYIGKTAFLDKLARKYIGEDGRVYMAFKCTLLFLSIVGFELLG